jgi:hypothetical protein
VRPPLRDLVVALGGGTDGGDGDEDIAKNIAPTHRVFKFLSDELDLGEAKALQVITDRPPVRNCTTKYLREGLTLVHFSAQPEPLLSLKDSRHPAYPTASV